MALHAYLDLPVRAEPRRVHNCLTYLFHAGAGFRGVDVLAAGTVAPLTIDPFRHALRKHRFSSRNPAFGRNFRNAVVAEHATVGDDACEARMIGAVVAGVHRPRSR